MNTKKNLLGVLYKSNSEKRDTSLRRSSVQTLEQGTSQPSQMLASQPSLGTSQSSQLTSSQQPSRVSSSQFSQVTVPQPSQLLWPDPSLVLLSQFSRKLVLLSSQVVTLKLARTRVLQPSQVLASLPSQGTSRVSASTAPPPAPPPHTPTAPAQPCYRRLSTLSSWSHRQLKQSSSLLCEHSTNAETVPFHLPRAMLAAESAGGAEGPRSTTVPLPPIQPHAAAASGPATTRAPPKSQVAPKNRAPPPRERNPRRTPQAGTGPLPNSRLCASLQQQQQLQPHPPQQPQRSNPTRTRGRSVKNPGAAARREPKATVPAKQYNIKLTADATRLLLRRHLEKEWGFKNPIDDTGLLPGSRSMAGLNLTSIIKISLLNEKNRYDDEEYEEDPAPGVVDQELVRRCTEWLRGVEEAKRENKLETLPHLYGP
ncbi:uncharacterized protein LOC142830687 [Pelodiscus sinensis]|uniref:uncharacterized protein LOC142830687 n=1 Tax=Pelodiscus sinensis TaxID=13735 RepID=UPI003F6BCF47